MTSISASILEGFSQPCSRGISQVVAHSLANSAAKSYAQVLVERQNERLRSHSSGLAQILESWSSDIADELVLGAEAEAAASPVGWGITLSALKSAVVDGRADAVHAASILALDLCSQTETRPWEATFTNGVRFKWQDLLLPRSSAVRHSGVLGSSPEWRDLDGKWYAAEGSGLGDVVHTFRIGDRDVGIWTRPDQVHDDIYSVNDLSVDGVTDADLALAKEAVELIRVTSPEYLEWLAPVIWGVLRLTPEAGMMSSFSQDHTPGMIGVSFPHGADAIGEMLIHEGCHQYFHAAELIGDIQLPDDEHEYTSPLNGRKRPVSKIILGFHAFANVILFSDKCLELGVGEASYHRSNVGRHRPEVLQMLADIQSSNAITDIGDSFWMPLVPLIEEVWRKHGIEPSH